MRGYDGLAHEDLDEYEEDGEEGYEEEEEEEEYEVAEPSKPTKEELEYLELRQRLKERIRKKLKKETGSARSNYHDKRNKLPYDNFGSFFGPSQPVIAQRVLQESKSLLETRHLESKNSNSHYVNKNNVQSSAAVPKVRGHDRQPKVNEVKTKVQQIRDTRDYSFLSDDAETSGPKKEPRLSNNTVPKSEEMRSTQASLRGQQSLNNGSSREERKPVPSANNFQRQPRPGSSNFAVANKSKYTSIKKPNLAPVGARKQLVQNNGSGPGRPVALKGQSPKVTAAKLEKSPVVAPKTTMPSGLKSSSKMSTSMPKQQLQQKKASQEPKIAKVTPKQPVMPSKPMISKSSKPMSSHASLQQPHKKKPVRRYSDDEDDEGGRAISMIRKMFGYNPNKFAGQDEDDSDMEANFADIQREEKRSARIARQEDEEELRLIEEEERREMLRKQKRKLSQR